MNWQAEPLWQVFEAASIDVRTMTPKPLEGPVFRGPVSAWQVEKVEAGKWLPKLPYNISGAAVKELREAYQLLDAAQSLASARHWIAKRAPKGVHGHRPRCDRGRAGYRYRRNPPRNPR
jgi:hypothetical protein